MLHLTLLTSLVPANHCLFHVYNLMFYLVIQVNSFFLKSNGSNKDLIRLIFIGSEGH